MRRVVLIQPPIRDFYLTQKRTLPLGLSSLAASLGTCGFEPHIMDGLATPKAKKRPWPKDFSHLIPFYGQRDTTHFALFHDFRHFGYSVEHMAAQVKKLNPLIVGISSLFTAYANQALETAQAIKKFCPHLPIVLGGHHPTQFPRQVLSHPAVDFVIRGEGEKALVALAKALHKKDQDPKAILGPIPGLAHGNHIPLPTWIKKLDTLPAAKAWTHPHYHRRGRAPIALVTSRGCPMSCSYCAVSSKSAHGTFRKKSIKNILDEFRHQVDEFHHRDVNIGFIEFEDENLTLDKKRFMDLLEGIQNILPYAVELRAMNGLSPPSLDREMVEAMARAGFKTLNLSLGASSREQLARFHRPDVINAHDGVLEWAQEFNLETVSYVIAGAPGQTPSSSLKDLLFLARRRTLAGLSIFYPAPGSLDYKRCKDLDILPKRFGLMRGSTLPLDHTTSRRQNATLLRLARILNFIKGQIDQGRGRDILTPRGLDSHGLEDGGKKITGLETWQTMGREEISIRLVQYFMGDGKIRGMDDQKNLYCHTIDDDLASQFRQGLLEAPILGIKKGR